MPQIVVYRFDYLTTDVLHHLQELYKDGFQSILWHGPQGTYILGTEDLDFTLNDYDPVVTLAVYGSGGTFSLTSGVRVYIVPIHE